MLAFGRYQGEEAVIPQLDLVIKVLEVRSNKTRTGMTAPVEVQFFRREVWEQLEACADSGPPGESSNRN